MSQKRKSKLLQGLYLEPRTQIWNLDKTIRGHRLCASTGSRDEKEAASIAIQMIAQHQRELTEGVRPEISFRQAATKYLNEEQDKRSIARDAQSLKILDPFIGDLPLKHIHDGTLRDFIQTRRQQGMKQSTINRDLAVARRIVILAARVWRHPNGLTYLETAPLIRIRPDPQPRKPYPISWAEERLLLPQLPAHLARMALYGINSGCREAEICQLRWSFEQRIPELDVSVFVLPGKPIFDAAGVEIWSGTKTKKDRVVVLNRIARSVIESVRGDHAEFVFIYRGHPVGRMLNSGWKLARKRASEAYKDALGSAPPWGYTKLRVHDLRHTLGRRMRAAGMSLEDREDVLGHSSGRMTTHYSAAEIGRLLEGLERVADGGDSREAFGPSILRVVGDSA